MTARTPGARAIASVVVVLVTAILLSSCELFLMAPEPASSPQGLFDQVWSFADREYSFFALKEIDWDAVYTTYQPRVEAGMTNQELFDLLAEMLYELKDGHVNLRSPFDFSRNWQWFLDYPQNFDYTILERAYFQGNEQFVGPFIVYDFGDIAYARYGSFASTITEEQLDYLFSQFAERKGFILDVRDNGGGSTSNAYRLADRLVSERTLVAYEQFKNGPEHNDFTPREAVYLDPPENRVHWEKPFVLLTNRSSYSATNLFAALVTGLPTVTLVGDTTGGGGGIPAFTELTNGWVLRVSAHRLFIPAEPDLLNVELGVPPDLKVDQDPADIDPADPSQSQDTILEAALSLIRALP